VKAVDTKACPKDILRSVQLIRQKKVVILYLPKGSGKRLAAGKNNYFPA
jgi:hypothetical protein